MTLLFLHAFPLDERMWAPQHEFGGQAPRLYGRGNTMDAWAASILDELSGDDLVVVGASMGGYCALALARQAPERVRALVLAGSRTDADPPDRRAGRADTIRLIREQGPEALWEELKPKLYADVSRADASLLHRDPDDLVAAVEAIRDRDDSTDVARSFRGRLLAVVCEHDPFVSAAELAELEPREVRGCGHLVSIERTEEFNGILREFLDRV